MDASADKDDKDLEDLVTIKVYSQRTGKTEKAIRRMIEEGMIVEKVHYYRDPRGRLWISRSGMRRWVTGSA